MTFRMHQNKETAMDNIVQSNPTVLVVFLSFTTQFVSIQTVADNATTFPFELRHLQQQSFYGALCSGLFNRQILIFLSLNKYLTVKIPEIDPRKSQL